MKVKASRVTRSVLLMKVAVLAKFLKIFPWGVRSYLLKNILRDKTYHPCLTAVVSDRLGKKKSWVFWFDLQRPEDAKKFLEPGIWQELSHFVKLADIVIISLRERGLGEEFFLEYRNTQQQFLPDILDYVQKQYQFPCRHILSEVKQILPHLDPKNSFMVMFSFSGQNLLRLEVACNIKKNFFNKVQKEYGVLPLNGLQASRKFRAEFSWILRKDKPPEVRIGRMLETEVPWRKPTGTEGPFYEYFQRTLPPVLLEVMGPRFRTGWIANCYRHKKKVQMNVNICLRWP